MALVMDSDHIVVDEQRVALENAGSPSEIERREQAVQDDLFCFVTFLGPGEGSLGLGLHVHPRTSSQRRKKAPPEFELVCDYIDAEAFNEGVRCTVQSGVVPTGELPYMTSSARQRLNGWFPLYINAKHWGHTRRFASSAFKLLSGRSCEVRPTDVLDVCCSLLTCAVVGFVKAQRGADAENRGRHQVGASERAVQMYADVQRTFLQMSRELPEVRRLAKHRLEEFIRTPAQRTRAKTPSLGNLIQCLLVSEDVTWQDLAPLLIPEALRRHASRKAWEGDEFDPTVCDGCSEKLIAAWDKFAPQVGMVSCFCAMFVQCIGRPKDVSLADVEVDHDRCWGRLNYIVMRDMIDACANLRKKESIAAFFPILFPSAVASSLLELLRWSESYNESTHSARTCDTLCELILWSTRHARFTTNQTIPGDQWPSLRDSCPLLDAWKSSSVKVAPSRRTKCRQVTPHKHVNGEAALNSSALSFSPFSELISEDAQNAQQLHAFQTWLQQQHGGVQISSYASHYNDGLWQYDHYGWPMFAGHAIQAISNVPNLDFDRYDSYEQMAWQTNFVSTQ
jgi:hypothetical protein